MRCFCDYTSQCIECVAQANSSSSSVAQRCQKFGQPWISLVLTSQQPGQVDTIVSPSLQMRKQRVRTGK